MKIKNLFHNYNIIIFIAFSIISIVSSFQNFPIWNNYQKEEDLNNELLNSEIISYTIENTTKEYLYLIRENNNNYLYIKNKKFTHSYINDLKYFTSPLMKYDGKYYFCSSLKNIIYFDLYGNFGRVVNNFNEDSDYELKCFYHRDVNVIAVTYINSYYMDFYDLVNSNWKNLYSSTRYFLTKLSGKIIDINSYNVDIKDETIFGIFYKNEEHFIYNFMKYYWEFDLGNVRENLTLGTEFYSKNLVSFGLKKEDNRGFIFTYEPKVMNKYNIYLLNLAWGACINKKGNLYLRIFQEAEIYYAYFIENSPILIYFIRKLEKNGLYNFYYGATDVEANFIIFNKRIDDYKKIFFDQGYLFKNEGYLKYFENGKIIEICPFIYSNNECKFILNENQYFYIEKSDGFYENTIINDCTNKIIFVQYCLEKCPIGYALSYYSGCDFCPIQDGNYYSYPTRTCIYPKKNYPNQYNIYYDCEEDNNSKYFNYNCYMGCSEIYGKIDPNNENQCITCSNEQKFFFNNGCIDNCNIEGYIEKSISLNGILYSFCLKCSEIDQFYYKNECHEKCPFESQFYDSDNICYFCWEKNSVAIYFQEGECVSECTGAYGIIDNDKEQFYCKYCKNENLYLLHNKRCEKNCEDNSLFYEDNHICYFCNETDLKFYQDGECVSGCSNGYEILENEYYCRNCYKENLYYTHNKKCEERCEEYSLFYTDNNICYFCNETDSKFYQNETCVNSCDIGWEANDTHFYCLNCFHESEYKYFLNGKCANNCSGLAYNDSDLICVNCTERDQLFKDDNHSCVVTCGTYIRNNNGHCYPCPNEYKFFEYDCVPSCPNYTVLSEEKYCRMCNGKFQENQCVDECSEGYAKTTAYIEDSQIEVNVCYKCKGNTFLEGSNCVENCSIAKYGATDGICRKCFCGFSIKNCNKSSDSCGICISHSNINEGEIFGDNCEFYSKIESTRKKLKIIPQGPIISSQKSSFTFEWNETEANKYYNYSIKWGVLVNNIEIKDLSNFPTGINEEIFIINSGLLKPGEIEDEIFNQVTLELNATDELNITETFNDAINISIQSIYQRNKGIYLKSEQGINRVMNNTFVMKTETLSGIDQIKFYYKILIKDEFNEIIPIKSKDVIDPLLDKQKKNLIFILPYLKQFVFEISSNRNEKYQILEDIENENLDISFSLEEIIKNELLDNYSEIERIFLIMKYLNLNKNDISNNEYDLLFNFIKKKSKLVAMANGHYEKKELNDNLNSERYYINYYEPNTIFSLLNKIFLNQGTKIPDKYFNTCLEIFDTFIDIIIKQNNNERLDNANIISFFRSFDHLMEIFINKEKSKGKNLINKNQVYEILIKLSKYLIREASSGENIRLIGRKISLFISRFGKYQKFLSFGLTTEKSKQIKYNDFNTFSYDNYNFNQEKCDDDGNTLLCIQKNYFNEFKQKMINIEDYCLSFISFNNDDNNAQNGNEEISFKIEILNLTDINQENDNLNFFYDIEFTFNFNPYTDNSKQFVIQNENKKIEKNYSNITCIPKNHLKNKDLYCLTFFNYDTDIIKCSCNVMDEITYVSNYEIANFYKDIQAKGKFKQYKLLNKITLIGICILLGSLLIPNLLYLLYEIKNDIKKVNNKLLSFPERIKQKYLKVKALNNSSIFSFSFYLFIFKFPLLSPLRNCEFKSPKYIKHFIIILAISYGMGLSLLLLLFYSPFKEKIDIIDKRDIKNPDFDVIDDHIIKKYSVRCLIFTIFGAFIARIFIYIFGIILNYNKDELKYWKNLKIILSNYVNNQIKGDVLLGNTWRKIKMRIKAYSTICGNYILSRQLKKKTGKMNKKFENYLLKSKANSKDYENRLLPKDIDEEMTELSDKRKKSGNYKSPSIYQNKNESFYMAMINDSKNGSFIMNSNFEIVNGQNFQLYSTKMKIDKSISKNNKFERIKNKYICPKNKNNCFEEEIGIGNRTISMISNNNYYKGLEISYENNFSFLKIEEFIINETLTKGSSNKWKSSNLSNTIIIPEGYWVIINISLILTILLLIIIIILISIFKKYLNDFGIFIINIWIGCSIFIYIIVYPLLYLIKNLIGSVLVFKCYHLRNRVGGKILYYLFVDKTMIYIFKVRNYITKYKKELDY